MIGRTDDGRAVTHLGDGPIRDHEGYVVDTAVADGAHLMQLRIALDNTPCRGIRADLNTQAVAELRDRCNQFLTIQETK